MTCSLVIMDVFIKKLLLCQLFDDTVEIQTELLAVSILESLIFKLFRLEFIFQQCNVT